MLHSFLWLNNIPLYIMFWGFPGDASGKEPTCQCRRHKRLRSDPWVKKITWRRKWQPTAVLLPGEFPWTEKPGRLQSIGLQRVRHDWNNLACTYFCFAYSFCILFIRQWTLAFCLFIRQWTLALLLHFGYCEHSHSNTTFIFVWVPFFNSLRYIPSSRITG